MYTVTAAINGTDLSASKTVNVFRPGDTVRIVSAYSGLAIQEKDGGYVQAGDNDSAYQYWTVGESGGVYTFTNLRSGNLLSDGGSGEWRLVPQDNGGYALVNAASGKAMDVYGNSRDEGTTVGTYDLSGDPNQCWNLNSGSRAPTVDTLADSTVVRRLVPTSIDGTASYGGSEEVSFEKAFDGDTSTHHDAWDGSNSYLVANLPQSRPVTLIRFFPREGFDWRMYGGKFYGVKDGVETLLYTVPGKLKKDWNEVYIQNDVIYDSIIYRTPEWGLCNVAELEYYNVPFTADMKYENGGVNIGITSYTGESELRLYVMYKKNGRLAAIDVDVIKAGQFQSLDHFKPLSGDYESADIYLMDGREIVTSGYVHF